MNTPVETGAAADSPTSAALPEAAERIYFPELDGLRFIAFLLVYLFHGGISQGIVARLIGLRAAWALRETADSAFSFFLFLAGT